LLEVVNRIEHSQHSGARTAAKREASAAANSAP
jgi:hypothetical protein